MYNQSAKTIQVFLPSGNARGIRRARVGGRTVRAIQIPRPKLSEAGGQENISEPGVYFLFNRRTDDTSKPLAYIGKAENCYKRLQSHHGELDHEELDSWETYTVINSGSEDQFTPNHTRYIEYKCIKKALEVNRFKIYNENTPTKPDIPEPILAELEDNFGVIQTLLSAFGFPVLDPLRSEGDESTLHMEHGDARAEGEYNEDGLVVFKGSTVDPKLTDAAKDVTRRRRNRLREEGIIVEENGSHRFTEDYVFGSPSAAAAVVAGTPINGWDAWQDSRGRTLKELDNPQ